MNIVKSKLAVAMLVFAVATAWAADEKAVEKDQAQLQGEWTMVSGARDGQAFPEEFMKGFGHSVVGLPQGDRGVNGPTA